MLTDEERLSEYGCQLFSEGSIFVAFLYLNLTYEICYLPSAHFTHYDYTSFLTFVTVYVKGRDEIDDIAVCCRVSTAWLLYGSIADYWLIGWRRLATIIRVTSAKLAPLKSGLLMGPASAGDLLSFIDPEDERRLTWADMNEFLSQRITCYSVVPAWTRTSAFQLRVWRFNLLTNAPYLKLAIYIIYAYQ